METQKCDRRTNGTVERALNVWAYLPLFGTIRYTTIFTAIVIAVIISWRTHKLWLGPLTALAWASAYEIIYEWTGTILHGSDLNKTAWMSAAVIAWVLLAYVKGARTDKILLGTFTCAWIIWISMGFYANNTMNMFDLASEILNVGTKTILALSYLFGTLRNAKNVA
jgi:hypothetical protein